jgi:pyruvate,orthophosphate dikinase
MPFGTSGIASDQVVGLELGCHQPAVAERRTDAPAFVLTAEVGRRFLCEGGLPAEAWEATMAGIADLEDATGRCFGGPHSPLLVSVRSGSMGLDLGINDDLEAAIAAELGDPACARMTHLRFIVSYAEWVLRTRVEVSGAVPPADLRAATEQRVGAIVPQDPEEQLRDAICAAFSSWISPPFAAYEPRFGLPTRGGTGVTVQAILFGGQDTHDDPRAVEDDDVLGAPGRLYVLPAAGDRRPAVRAGER